MTERRSRRRSIADGRVHVLDGAMGTMLYSRGVFVNVCYDELNLEPARAGRRTCTRRTCGPAPSCSRPTPSAPTRSSSRPTGSPSGPKRSTARRPRSRRAAARGRARRGRRHRPARHPDRAVGPDREGRGGRALRPAGRGPARGRGGRLHPRDVQRPRRAARGACRRCGGCADLPVIAQMTVGEDGNTPLRHRRSRPSPRGSTEWGADVIGLNCSVGPAPMLDAIERMAEVTDRPLSAQPNAGLPARGRRPPDLPREPRVHGAVRPAADPGGRPVRRRVLRHHARAHPADPRVRRRHAAAPRRPAATAPAARSAEPPRAEPVPLARALAARAQARRGRAGHDAWRSCRRAAGTRRAMIEQCRALKAAGRRRGQRARRAAGAEPDGRAAGGAASSSARSASRRSSTTPAATATCSAC